MTKKVPAPSENCCEFFIKSNDYVSLLQQKKIMLALSIKNLYGYEGVLINVLEICKLSGARLQVVIYDDSYVNIIKNLLLFIRPSKKMESALAYCETITSKYKELVSINFYSTHDSVLKAPIRLSSSVLQILYSYPELYRSIHAAWYGSNLKTLHFSVKGIREKLLWREQLFKFNLGYNLVKEFSSRQDYGFVFVPNGKYPDQVGIKCGAKAMNLQVLYFEHDNRRTFLQPFQTQDVVRLSSALNNWTLSLKPSEVRNWVKWADDWIARQGSNSFQNQFLNFGSQFDVADTDLKYKLEEVINSLIVIFTSSIDERVSNLSIDLNGWAPQSNAIVECAKKIRQDGFYPHVRLHPNMQWKSLRDLLELLKALEKSQISYQLPWEGPSTYWLLGSSKSVVTWGSTVALESMSMGIPTYNLGPSKYQEITGIMTFNDRTLHEFNFNFPISPDVKKAKLAIFATKNYGIQDQIHPIFNNYTEKTVKSILTFPKKSSLVLLINVLKNPFNSSSRDFFRVLSFLCGPCTAKKILVKFSKFVN